MKLFFAVSFDWEALLPLLLFLLYGLSQFLGSRKKGSEEEVYEEPDPDRAAEEERARQVREEIRRRVAQRQESESHEVTSVERQQQPASTIPAQRSQREERPQPVPSRGSGDGGMIARLTDQKRRLELARREKAKAERETRSIYDKARRSGSRYKRRAAKGELAELVDTSNVRDDVLRILSDPANARRGILLSEILGPPVGSKPHQTDRY